MKKLCGFCFLMHRLLMHGALVLGFATPVSAIELNVGAEAYSEYITEGRDNLDRDGLVALSGSAKWRSMSLDAWYGQGDRQAYDEFNITAAYRFNVKSVEGHVSYTRLEFFHDSLSDNEVAVGIASLNANILTSLNYVHASEADGGFAELRLAVPLDFDDGALHLEPYLLQGLDFGFSSAEHDGRNHLQAGLTVSAMLDSAFSFFCDLAYSWAQEDIRREGLGDEAWIRVGVNARLH